MISLGLFSYSTKPRGSVVHAAHLAEALTHAGLDVTLYALSKAGDTFFRELACKLVLLPAKPADQDPERLIRQRVAEFASGLAALAANHDLYHAEDCLAASGLLEVLPAVRPIVRTVHHVERFENQYLQACQRRSVLEADAVLTVSALGQREVRAHFGRVAPVIANGVEHALFELAKVSSDDRERRARFDLGPETRVVLSVGGVEPRKNSLNGLEAMVPLLSQRPELEWWIVGGASIWEHAECRARFEARLAELPPGVRRRVRRLGAVDSARLMDLYLLGEVLLCPSLQEGFGLCVVEAMAAGLPVLVSNTPPFDEYLDETCASFADPFSAPSITRELASLLDNAKLRERRSAAGEARSRRFTWSGAARAHLEFYDALLARESAKPRPGEASLARSGGSPEHA